MNLTGIINLLVVLFLFLFVSCDILKMNGHNTVLCLHLDSIDKVGIVTLKISNKLLLFYFIK